MNDRLRIDAVDPAEELAALLDFNEIKYRRYGTAFRFRLSDKGLVWETLCHAHGGAVLIYGVYPFAAADAMRGKIDEVNAELTSGAFFTRHGRLVLRTSADLFDAYAAYEAIGRALEYNAGAMVAFWPVFQSLISLA